MQPPEADAFGPLRPPEATAAVPKPPLPPSFQPRPPAMQPMPSSGFPGYGLQRPVLPPVSDAVLRIPLGTRELVRQALDLLTRSDSGLRGPSFYIGFLLLVTLGPLAVIFGLVLALGQDVAPTPSSPYGAPPPP